jgi:hypothetical protein
MARRSAASEALRVSGKPNIAQANTVKLTIAVKAKIASQPNNVSRTPPMSGATIGISTTTEVTSPIIEAACSRS